MEIQSSGLMSQMMFSQQSGGAKPSEAELGAVEGAEASEKGQRPPPPPRGAERGGSGGNVESSMATLLFEAMSELAESEADEESTETTDEDDTESLLEVQFSEYGTYSF